MITFNRSQIRLAVCRCFFGCDWSSTRIWSMIPSHGPSFGRSHRLLPFVARRQRKLQHLPDRLPRQAELSRRLPDAHAVHLHGSSYARIHFHLVHLPVSHKTQLPCNVLDLKVWWSTFRPPQNAAHAALRGLLLLRRLETNHLAQAGVLKARATPIKRVRLMLVVPTWLSRIKTPTKFGRCRPFTVETLTVSI